MLAFSSIYNSLARTPHTTTCYRSTSTSINNKHASYKLNPVKKLHPGKNTGDNIFHYYYYYLDFTNQTYIQAHSFTFLLSYMKYKHAFVRMRIDIAYLTYIYMQNHCHITVFLHFILFSRLLYLFYVYIAPAPAKTF